MERILIVFIICLCSCVTFKRCTFIKKSVSEDKSIRINSERKEIDEDKILNHSYYVSNNGNDDNTGSSPDQAWKSIAKVNATVLTPGTTVYFKRGNEWREALMIDESGTSDAMITFTAYGTGPMPIINGADIIKKWSKASVNIWSADCPDVITFYGLPYDYMAIINGEMLKQVGVLAAVNGTGKYFIDKSLNPDKIYIYSAVDPNTKNAEVSARKFGICVTDRIYIKLKNLDFRNAAHSGAFFYAKAATSQYAGHSIIDSCNFFRNRISGIIFVDGYSNNRVQNCTSTYNGNGFYSSSDKDWGSDHNTFTHCYSSHNINYTAGVYSDGHGFGIWNSDNNVVEHCESDGDKYGIVIDPNSRHNDIIIRYNYVHDTQERSPGINVGGNTPDGTFHQVYYNLIVNTGAGEDGYAIWIYGASRKGKVHIFNNTIFQDGGTMHNRFGIFASAGNNLEIKNNIVYSAGFYPFAVLYLGSGSSEMSLSNNIYFTPNENRDIFYYAGNTSATIADWQKLTGQEANSLKINPLFGIEGSDFSLQDNSPCINSGVNLGFKYDISGNPIVGLPDIGCYEKK